MKKLILTLFVLFAANFTFGQENAEPNSATPAEIDSTAVKILDTPLVTFIELGSTTCIPCKQMQPVMISIEAKYGTQVKVIFYDVWKAEQKEYAQKYKIRLIPTQVFLDAKGKEFFRHEGFFAEKEIDKLVQSKGATPHPGKEK